MQNYRYLGKLYEEIINHWIFRPTFFRNSLESKTGVRHYTKSLEKFIISLGKSAVILDICSGNRKISDNVLSLDIENYPKLTVQSDALSLPFKDESFDGVILQQALEHIIEPERALQETKRVLRKGGSIFVSVPFIEPLHEKADFYRFTEAGFNRIISKYFLVKDIYPYAGMFSALSLLIFNFLKSIFSGWKVIQYPILLCYSF